MAERFHDGDYEVSVKVRIFKYNHRNMEYTRVKYSDKADYTFKILSWFLGRLISTETMS